MNPRYPVYIISKGRWKSRITSKTLDRMSVPYRIVVEPQEYDEYAKVISPEKILTLPFGNLGKGSVPARNWCWDHAISEGHEWHWMLDDNIRHFRRMNRNKKTACGDGTCFYVVEDFVNRYTNVALAGLQLQMFLPTNSKFKPFSLNMRVYCCVLVRNDIPYRWRGKYGENADLSVRVLKDGWCTILINAFTCDKVPTMTMKGGNTDTIYKDGTNSRLEMARALRLNHPDVVRAAWRGNRWRHSCDYSRFKKNKLVRRSDIVIPTGVNEYGMSLVDVQKEKK